MTHEDTPGNDSHMSAEVFGAMVGLGREPLKPIEIDGKRQDGSLALAALEEISPELDAEIQAFVDQYDGEMLHALAALTVDDSIKEKGRYIELIARLSDIDDVAEGRFDVAETMTLIEEASELSSSDKQALLMVLGELTPDTL